MNVQEKYMELRSEYVKARSNKDKERIFDELSELIANHREELAEVYEAGIHDLAESTTLELFRQRIKPVLKVIQSKAIAEKLGKSASWFTQRMNGNIVSGTAQRFKLEEMEQIEQAIRSIGNELAHFKVFE